MTRPSTRTVTRSHPARPPVAAAMGILAGCAATLIGVATQLSPEVILVRAVVAGGVTFVLAALLVAWWRCVTPHVEEE
ncbi:hypothetical protein [Planctomicrobium sp. SH527]|uniref:hypothetical protein n=1 Tax=Planctomicrobium sp. SH527 TaxID=3448123 RepID=UPI003F5B9022